MARGETPLHELSERGQHPRPHHESHYEQAKRALEALAEQRAADGHRRLPAEDQLAAETGFSRPTVRSALLAMQKEGKVLRRHGVGTFINRHALGMRANLAEDSALLSVIEELGYEPLLDIVRLAEEPLPRRVAQRIDAKEGADAVVIDRLFRASGTPAAMTRDHIPSHHLMVDAAQVSAERSVFSFVRRWTPYEVRYSIATLHATEAAPQLAQLLEIPPGAPVLAVDHLHIDDRDEIVGATESFVRNDIIRYSVVRTNTDR
jgi:GntR family transcriptional regulator